jgi:hypothetical protein
LSSDAPPVASRSSENRRGIVAMLTAMTLSTDNDTIVKLATTELPQGQIMAVRGLFGVLIAFVLVVATGEAHRLGALASPVVVLRALVESGVVLTLFGITAVVSSGLYTIHREQVRRPQASAPSGRPTGGSP